MLSAALQPPDQSTADDQQDGNQLRSRHQAAKNDRKRRRAGQNERRGATPSVVGKTGMRCGRLSKWAVGRAAISPRKKPPPACSVLRLKISRQLLAYVLQSLMM